MNNTNEMIDSDYWPEYVFGFQGVDDDIEGDEVEDDEL